MTLTPTFETSFSALLDAWTNHFTLHEAGAEPAELLRSRNRLDQARRAAAMARKGL